MLMTDCRPGANTLAIPIESSCPALCGATVMPANVRLQVSEPWAIGRLLRAAMAREPWNGRHSCGRRLEVDAADDRPWRRSPSEWGIKRAVVACPSASSAVGRAAPPSSTLIIANSENLIFNDLRIRVELERSRIHARADICCDHASSRLSRRRVLSAIARARTAWRNTK
jgi:hypothetical protein